MHITSKALSRALFHNLAVHVPEAIVNRRNVLRSGAALAGGFALIGMPRKAFAVRPILPPPINPNIANAYCTTTHSAVAGVNENSLTSTELTAHATAFATWVDEMNSTGNTAAVQASLTSQASAISALDPAAVNVAALLAQAQKVAPVTYAQMLVVAQQISSASQSAALASNAVASIFSTYETAMQALAALAQQRGGVLNISSSSQRGKPHLMEVLLPTHEVLYIAAGVLGIIGIFCPPIEMAVFLGATLYLGDAFSVMGMMSGIAGAVSEGDGN